MGCTLHYQAVSLTSLVVHVPLLVNDEGKELASLHGGANFYKPHLFMSTWDVLETFAVEVEDNSISLRATCVTYPPPRVINSGFVCQSSLVLRLSRRLGQTFSSKAWVKELSVELYFESLEAMTFHLTVEHKCYDFYMHVLALIEKFG